MFTIKAEDFLFPKNFVIFFLSKKFELVSIIGISNELNILIELNN